MTAGTPPTAPTPGRVDAPAPLFLSCVSGPDAGKRLRLRETTVTLGRDAACEFVSDDPDVAVRHAWLSLDGRVLFITAIESAQLVVDGRPLPQARLSAGQQLRVGRSVWRLETLGEGERVGDFLGRMSDRISSAAGVERIEGFSVREMFSEVFRHRTDEEREEYFNVGTRTTTPDLAHVDTSWPRPWAFARTFTLALGVFAIFVWAWNQFDNPLLLPGLIITGAFAIPLALLVFFFEVNVPRNVSLYQVIKLLLLGGIVSIVVSLVGFQWTNLDSWLGAMSAGIVEETGKALTLLLVVRNLRYRWTLNGMLFGATVGTGFGIFETAGYALNYGAGAAMQFGMSAGSQTMLQILEQRGMLSVFGSHTLYTAIVGAALWRVRGTQPFRLEMLFDPRFLRLFAFSVGLHMLWNSPIELPFYGKYLVVGFVSWVVIMSLLQDGLRQVRDAQAQLATDGAAATPGVAAPAGAYAGAYAGAPSAVVRSTDR